MPPIAQRLPETIVSHRLRSRMTCCCFWLLPRSAATMLSMTSTPRVEPMRQGVHLPQDSIVQNSIA
jgi:hypothetical protein